MAYQYDINTSKKDKASSVCLFTTHSISQIIALFVNTFLVGLIYSYVDGIYNYIFNVCIFIGVTYIFMGAFIIPISYLIEKTNRVWIYRLGIILRTGLVVVSIFYGKDISRMLVLAGALNGISNAFYYASYNTIKQEMVSRKSMRSFALISQIGRLFVSIVAPVLLGMLIDVSTYSQVAIYVLIICAIQIGFSFGVKSKKPDESKFDLKGYFNKLKQNPEVYKKIKAIYWGTFIYGLTTIVTNLLNICIMMQFGTNLSLGAFNSIVSAVSMITILLFNKFTKRGKRKVVYILSAILPFVCTLVFAIWPSITTLIIYNLGTAISGIIYVTVYDVYRNGILKEAGMYSEITEHQALVEVIMEVARVVSHGLLLLLSLFHSLIVFKIVLCISVLSYSGIILFLLMFEKKHLSVPANNDVENDKVEDNNSKQVNKK